jgi:hypothetical protein
MHVYDFPIITQWLERKKKLVKKIIVYCCFGVCVVNTLDILLRVMLTSVSGALVKDTKEVIFALEI